MAKSLDEVKQTILSAANGRSIRLIAVSKKQSIQKISELYALGHRDFGENYPQELVSKALEAKQLGLDQIRWHLIGHLQSNKINMVLPWISSFHALDSLALAEKISSKVIESFPERCPLSVYLQVNIDAQESKGGFLTEKLEDSINLISNLKGLKLEGLMVIPNPENSQNSFQQLKKISDKFSHWTQGRLSMGMSSDFESAIIAGSTDVRVGSLLFGSRNSGTSI